MKKSALASLLFTLATCGGPQASGPSSPAAEGRKASKPLVDVQAAIDSCKANNDAACLALCNQVFAPGATESITSCNYAVQGDQVALEATVQKVGGESYSGSNEPGCAGGRRPFGLDCPASPAASAIAAFFAHGAQLEAASVVAFGRIHQYLERRGAPAALLARIRDAVVDELDHARRVIALARRYGAEPVAPVIAPEPELSPLARAIDNAVEGCVGESVAALQALAIAESARDPEVRAVFAQIATDEASHALLAFELAELFARDLDAGDLRLVDEARRVAAARAIAAPPAEVLVALGVPSGYRVPAAVASLA